MNIIKFIAKGEVSKEAKIKLKLLNEKRKIQLEKLVEDYRQGKLKI